HFPLSDRRGDAGGEVAATIGKEYIKCRARHGALLPGKENLPNCITCFCAPAAWRAFCRHLGVVLTAPTGLK
ncbi:MAG: hypothetical protein JXA18_15660, partial [Chitinispirillaceae bacterium]|nr:hypothetical protein [Chitinispirillaceae bacterium]